MQTLALRAGHRCSNPECRNLTCGPAEEPSRALVLGIAAHICAAAPGGPRYEASQTEEQRSSIGNGMWLCVNCSTLIDKDKERYSPELLHEWKDKAEQEARKLLETNVPPAEGGVQAWNVPHPRLQYFTGREGFLDDLNLKLKESGTAQVIAGLGGIGKTQTAVEHAYRQRENYTAVFWVGANTELDITNAFIGTADLLSVPYDKTDAKTAIRAVKNWLGKHSNWLLIFDNADHPDVVKGYIPSELTGHVLLTSRASVFDAIGITRPLKLPELTKEESVAFLFCRTGRAEGAAEQAERFAMEQLAEEMEGLPLALEQAGAYIIRTGMSFGKYLENYRTHKLATLKKHGPVTGDYTESVATTWLMNFEEVRKISEASADLLRFSAFLSPDHIPFELIARAGDQLGPAMHAFISKADDPGLAVTEALEPLTRFSLARVDTADESYSMHRLVQEVLKERDDT